MKASSILVVPGLLVLSLNACGGDTDDDDDGGCAKGCATVSSLNCPNQDKCVETCEEQITGLKALFSNCGTQVDALMACFTSLPVSAYSCNAEGDPEPNMSECRAQQDALSMCANG